jgi:predicted ATPase/class 3 adenylate cyclase
VRHLPTGTVTLLFTDIEGSTHLLQRLGSRYAQILTECRTLLRAAFEQWDGYEVDTQGDAFFVAFTSAADALAAAVNAQRALFTHSWPEDGAVRVRMGLHTGEPEATSEGYIGMDVHHAARVMSAGHGGQVLLSQVTRDLVASELSAGVDLRDLGEYSLKDIEGVNRLSQLVIADLPNDFPPLRASGPRQIRYLPLAPTPFIGREQEVATARNLLRNPSTRLLTLVGPAGVGKTRLALQVATSLANAFLNGVAFIDLSQARDTESFVAAIAQLLAIKEEAGQALLERVAATLQELHILLVLDNFEQVTAARPILASLLATCDRLQVLVTSRVVLHMQAERILEVPPLALPDVRHLPDLVALSRYEAINLFVQRAQAMQPDFCLTPTNAPYVARICTRLDGIPLAIELAATRSRYFPPQALLAQLESGLNILSKKSPDIPLRQQTLRGAIAWSYELLSEEERLVFRRLAVCAQGCMIAAAQQICGLEEVPTEIVETLVDQSMLQLQQQSEQGPRLMMLQTLREYGLERLAEAHETEATQTRHALYYLSWAQQAVTFSTGSQQVEWLDRQEQEYENLRTALEWMLQQSGEEWGERALLFCIALMNLWEIRGPFSEGAAFLQRALAVGPHAAPTTRAEALQQAAYLALSMDNATRAESLLRESQLLFRASQDKAGMANILRMQGSLAWAKGNYKLARRLLAEALTIYRELGDRRGVNSTRATLAQIAIIQCDFSRARALLEENIAHFQAWDERYQTAHPLYHLARILFLTHSPLQQASELAERSLALFRQVGNGRLVAYVLSLLAQIHLAQKDTAGAQQFLEEALSKFEEVGDRYGSALALTISAWLSTLHEDTTTARKRYEESWQLLLAIDARELRATCLEGTGEVLLAQGEATRATQLWAQAATLRADMVAPIPPIYRGCYERAVTDARKQLGAEDFQAAWIQGRQALLEQASIQE